MLFNPGKKKTENEPLFRRGEYGFEVVEAEERVSGNGNLMIVLNLKVSDGNGRSVIVIDYLLAKKPLKLREAAYGCGIGAKFETGCLKDDDFVGKRGRLKLKVAKDEAGEYPDKNAVQEYVVEKKAALALPASVDDVVKRYQM